MCEVRNVQPPKGSTVRRGTRGNQDGVAQVCGAISASRQEEVQVESAEAGYIQHGCHIILEVTLTSNLKKHPVNKLPSQP